MNENLLTAGKFAELASTTKRTVTWYDKKGILKPCSIDSSGYRYYKPEQIIDLQVILLFRQLNFSIEQIKKLLVDHSSLKELFDLKREYIVSQIDLLNRQLNTIDQYYENLATNGSFVNPTVKTVKSFDVYCIDKVGPYSKIDKYLNEFKLCFDHIPDDAEYVSIFEEPDYKPVKSKFKIGVVISNDMKVKGNCIDIVKKFTLPSFKALSYTHIGSPSLLSFHWKQIEKYAELKNIEQKLDLPFVDIELYKKTALNDFQDVSQMITEMLMPIE